MSDAACDACIVSGWVARGPYRIVGGCDTALCSVQSAEQEMGIDVGRTGRGRCQKRGTAEVSVSFGATYSSAVGEELRFIEQFFCCSWVASVCDMRV